MIAKLVQFQITFGIELRTRIRTHHVGASAEAEQGVALDQNPRKPPAWMPHDGGVGSVGINFDLLGMHVGPRFCPLYQLRSRIDASATMLTELANRGARFALFLVLYTVALLCSREGVI